MACFLIASYSSLGTKIHLSWLSALFLFWSSCLNTTHSTSHVHKSVMQMQVLTNKTPTPTWQLYLVRALLKKKVLDTLGSVKLYICRYTVLLTHFLNPFCGSAQFLSLFFRCNFCTSMLKILSRKYPCLSSRVYTGTSGSLIFEC